MNNSQLSINNYQLPEGYKQTEIGVIPEDWEVKVVGEVCDFIVPGRNKPKVFKGDIPWITTPDLEDGRSVSESKVGLFVSRDEAKNVGSKIVPKGSVLMSCVGELGIVAFAKREIVINQQLHAFIPTEEIDAFFLLNALQSRKDYMLSIATITAVPYLNKGNCNSIPVSLPPLPEQRAIATTLSDVDALIASLDKLIAKQRHLKTATMQQLLTGKKRLPGFGEGKGYEQTKVGVIPEDWEVKAVGDVCDFIVPGRNKPKVFNGNIPWITTPDLDDGRSVSTSKLGLFISREEAKKVGSRIVPAGSVLMSCVGELGIVAFVEREIVINQQLHAFLPSGDVDPVFLLNVLQMKKEYMLSIATITAVPYMNKDNCNSIPVTLPQFLEQRAIATVLSDMDAAIAALETRRAKTQAIKQGMMQQLLTGRIRLV